MFFLPTPHNVVLLGGDKTSFTLLLDHMNIHAYAYNMKKYVYSDFYSRNSGSSPQVAFNPENRCNNAGGFHKPEKHVEIIEPTFVVSMSTCLYSALAYQSA